MHPIIIQMTHQRMTQVALNFSPVKFRLSVISNKRSRNKMKTLKGSLITLL